MKLKLHVLTAGALFFLGQSVMAQQDTTATKEIEQVVMIGYSKVNRNEFVGTATQIGSKVIDEKAVSNISTAIAGEVAGVSVLVGTGQPGSTATIRIRGFGSVNGNRDPLYVVDGVTYDGPLNAINPQDVQTMTILKDATATAIYGARGANGVIVITTKRGSANHDYIQFDSRVGVNTSLLPRYSVIHSPEEYIGLAWEAMYNQGLFLKNADPINYANTRLFSSAGIGANYNMWNVNSVADLIDPTTHMVRAGVTRKYTPENWEDYAFHPALRYENNLTMSGGSGTTNYYTNFGYLDDKGYSVNSRFQRYSSRINVGFKPRKWINATMDMSYAYSKNNAGGQSSDSGSIFWFVDNIPPIFPLFTRDAAGNKIPANHFPGFEYDYGTNGRGFGALTNSIADATYDLDRTIRHELNTNFFVSLDLAPGLTFENRFGAQYSNSSYDGIGNPFYGGAASQGGSIYKEKDELFSWKWYQLLRYNKRFGNHGIEAFAAHEATSYDFKIMDAFKTGLIDPNIPEFNNAITTSSASSYVLNYRLESYFGTVSYDYMNKYLFSGTVRRDGSSRFLKDKWDNFWSAGIGWVLTKENFLKDNNVLNNLKLKASYGITGDQAGVGYYPGYNVYDAGNFMGLIAAAFDRSGYPNLTWERQKQYQVGLDFALFKSRRITGSVDYFNKLTDNLIFDKRLAPSTGNAIDKTNDGKLVNRGIEFNVVGHIIKSQDFYLDLGINGSHLTNKLTHMPIDNSTGLPKVIDIAGAYGRSEGHSIFDFYMREWAGVNPDNGKGLWVVKYTDNNGNGAFDTGEQIASLYDYMKANPNATVLTSTTDNWSNATQQYVGKTAIPKISGAANLAVGYKGFNLTAQLLYSFGGYGYDSKYATLMSNSQIGGNNWSTDILKRWQKPGDITDVPRLTSNMAGDTNFNSTSTRFLTKLDYLALNNVSLSYTLSPEMLENTGLTAVSLSLTGDNLWLNSKRRGFNPTVFEDGSSSMYTYAPLSNFTVGIKVKF